MKERESPSDALVARLRSESSYVAVGEWPKVMYDAKVPGTAFARGEIVLLLAVSMGSRAHDAATVLPKKWFLIPKSSVKKEAEIGVYYCDCEIKDLYLAYSDKGLVAGFQVESEAIAWRDFGKYDEKSDTWIEVPPRPAPKEKKT